MSDRLIQLSLPPFAFLNDEGLNGRCIIFHVRSASVIEILRREDALYLEPRVLKHYFDYITPSGSVKRWIAALHYCAVLDPETDGEHIMKNVIIPACEYYLEHLAENYSTDEKT